MTPCSQCGGSGVLRLTDQRYRTCLECLGQGQLSGLSAAITTAALFQSERSQPERAKHEASTSDHALTEPAHLPGQRLIPQGWAPQG